MDPTFLPATSLGALLRKRELGCLELLDHYIARIERLDGRINAVVVRNFDRARARARALDSQTDRGAPLFGVPMTVKESFDVAGLPTTRGHQELKNRPAAASSLSVQRLEEAGAVVFGKTNVPVDLADWQSYNPVYGATSNPWSVAHTPGGSSGGSAAALAAGFTALEIGSDIGGSIRIPAHFCGVFGHKPTWALCPNYGDPATSAAAPTDIAVIGPMARSADDLEVALNVMAGPDPADSALRLDLPAPRFSSLKQLRVAVWTREPGQETDAELSAKLDDLAAVLEREGATVSRSARPALNATEAFHLYLKLLDAAWSARNTEDLLAQKRKAAATLPADDMSADAIMARCVDMPHRIWLGLNEQRARLRRAWTAFFQEWDVLLCPPMSTPALLHMQQGATWERRYTVNGRSIPYNDMLFWPGLTCGYHLPGTVVPVARSAAGLPVGVQIAGPVYGDRITLAAAKLLEATGCTFVAPEGWE